MGAFDDLFGGGSQQASADLQAALQQAQQEAQQATQRGIGFLDPFAAFGRGAGSSLASILGTSGLQNIQNIGAAFQQSPQFKFRQQQAQGALQNQLQAAGLGGSGIAAQRAAELSSNLAGQGLQQFTTDVTGAQRARQQGLESLFSGGLGAAGQQAGLESNLGRILAGLSGQIGQAQAAGDIGHAKAISQFGQSFGAIPGLLASFGSF